MNDTGYQSENCGLYEKTGTNNSGNHWCSSKDGTAYHYNNSNGSTYTRFGNAAVYISPAGFVTFFIYGRERQRFDLGRHPLFQERDPEHLMANLRNMDPEPLR
ncbi:hypothetical protein FRC16_003338 [Serendipita sp. 398]|nr:hypothetical protein FRC16_003338 [Serendipita sp. 398]KAG8838504.1 hypothetical protein FRC18_004136 [Serendipita sp. 400]